MFDMRCEMPGKYETVSDNHAHVDKGFEPHMELWVGGAYMRRPGPQNLAES
jgi:hypothetical protein